MRLHLVTLTLTGCLMVAAGCSSPSGGTTAPPPGSSAGATAPAAAAEHFTAEQVAKALQAHGLPVKNVVVYNETTDPNGSLGRPGQYSSKVSFRDDRVKKPSAIPGVPKQPQDATDGGSVEVFDNASDALARGDYIQTITRGIQILGSEYDFLAGGVLLRLAGALTPSAARQYADALKAITGTPIVTPSPRHT